VLVELVPRPGTEVDNAEIEALALRGIDDLLPKDFTREEWADCRFPGQIANFDDLHRAISQPRATRLLLESVAHQTCAGKGCKKSADLYRSELVEWD
jgi:hypothetical protein